MRFALDPTIALPLAALALLAAGGIWYVLVRPVPQRVVEGAVVDVAFRAAERVEKSVPQGGRAVETGPRRTAYTLPDRHVYTVRLDGADETVEHAVPSLGEPTFRVGQRVRLRVRRREIPFVGSRLYVNGMDAVEE